MDYFSKFLRSSTPVASKQSRDHAGEFHKSWLLVKETLTHPDERQLAKGIQATEVPAALKLMVDCLVWESTRTEEGVTGACMEYLLKNDVLGTLVRLSEPDRPSGIQVEVLRTVQSMVVLLDEQFLVHSAVHRAVLRLLRTCVGDDIQEQLDGRRRVMGAARTASRTAITEYEEDLVDLLCLLCSRIRTFRELLMIFFYDKHWYRPEVLSEVPEEDEEEEEDEAEKPNEHGPAMPPDPPSSQRPVSPAGSQETVTSAPASSAAKKPEYEFILFNYLLRFVHREGKIGEFARAGLLFLMDVAMSPGVPVHRIAGDELKASTSSSTLSIAQTPTMVSDPIADAALALAEYILDGDFSEVLGAGLGAVYSLLPSKLEVIPEIAGSVSSNESMVIGRTGPETYEEKEKKEAAREKARGMGVDTSTNPDFKARLDHFVKLLEFLQDVLRRNIHNDSEDPSLDPSAFVGAAIVQSILDAVRRIFLENVLYPSILECSDADGSAVAVMSYIEVMFRTLHDPQFSEMLLEFLVSEDDMEPSSTRRRPQTRVRPTLLLDGTLSPQPVASRATKMKRRKSSAMLLLEMEAPDARRQSDYFTAMGRFTIKDLLLANLRSPSQAAGTAALQLMQTLLAFHCPLVVSRLFIHSVERPPIHALHEESAQKFGVDGVGVQEDEEESFTYPGAEADPTPRADTSFLGPELVSEMPDVTYSMHERELGFYLSLCSRIDPSHSSDSFSTGYEHYLRDAVASITEHPCYDWDRDIDNIDGSTKHLLDPNDPVLSLVLETLRRFFSNTPELNISLTGMLAAIGSCPVRSLKGWLLFAADQSLSAKSVSTSLAADDGDDRSVDYGVANRMATRDISLEKFDGRPAAQPVVYAILHGLVSSLERFRNIVPNFDTYLSERRQGLLFSENLTDALSLSFDLSGSVTGVADSPRRLSGTVETPPQRPKPKAKSGWSSLLTPRKNRPEQKSSPAPSEPATPQSKSKAIEASPFGSHYQTTSSIVVEPLVAPPPASEIWTPPVKQTFNAVEEDVFGSSGQWANEVSVPLAESPSSEHSPLKNVTLSQILDNVVILEESIKELTAILHARRSLGIDPIRYV